MRSRLLLKRCEFPKVLLQTSLNEIEVHLKLFNLYIFIEAVGLTAAKFGLNEFLWSRFLNVAPSDT